MENEVLHHVVPVSLGGEDFKFNLMGLKQQTHRDLHNILDIQPKIFSQKIRKLREKTNHKLIVTDDAVEILADLQRMFFDRIGHLPKYVQKEHVTKALERMEYYHGIYEKITGDKLDEPSGKDFKDIHENTISTQREIASVLKKHMELLYV